MNFSQTKQKKTLAIQMIDSDEALTEKKTSTILTIKKFRIFKNLF